MSALYVMKYAGQADAGGGAVYIGRGKVLGVDITGIKYDGSYTEGAGRMKGTVTLISPPGGASLVTGLQLSGGQKIPLTIDWPSNFASGQPQQLGVAGRSVSVKFEKIGDVP